MTEQIPLYNGISKIAWGFVFILFHIKINSIDLLPDFAGYILIAMGIGALSSALEHTKVLKPLSIVLSIWTASVWFTETISLHEIAFMGYISTAMGIATLIFNIILLTDLSILAAKYQPENKNIDRQLIIARNIYAICCSVSIGLSMASLMTLIMHSEILTGIATALSIASGFAMLVIMVIILIALFSLRNILKETPVQADYGTYDIPPFNNDASRFDNCPDEAEFPKAQEPSGNNTSE